MPGTPSDDDDDDISDDDMRFLQQLARESQQRFADLMPTPDLELSAQKIRHIRHVAKILRALPRDVLAGAVAHTLVTAAGKGASVIARRMVEVNGRAPDGDDAL